MYYQIGLKKSRLNEVTEVIEILSDDQEQDVLNATLKNAVHEQYISQAIMTKNVDIMKKSIFRVLIDIYPEADNLRQINKRYITYFQDKIGMNISKDFFCQKYHHKGSESTQIDPTQIIVHGVDFLSKQCIEGKFKVKNPLVIEWINASNVSIKYESQQELQMSLKFMKNQTNQIVEESIENNKFKWIQLKCYQVLGFDRKLFYRMAAQGQALQKQRLNSYQQFKNAKDSIQQSDMFVNKNKQLHKDFYDQKMKEFNDFSMGRFGNRRYRSKSVRNNGSDYQNSIPERSRSRNNRQMNRREYSDRENRDFSHKGRRSVRQGAKQGYQPYPTDRQQVHYDGENDRFRNKRWDTNQKGFSQRPGTDRPFNNNNNNRNNFNRNVQNSFSQRSNRLMNDETQNMSMILNNNTGVRSKSRSNSSVASHEMSRKLNNNIELQISRIDHSMSFTVGNINANNNNMTMSRNSSQERSLDLNVKDNKMIIDKDGQDDKSLGEVLNQFQQNQTFVMNQSRKRDRSRSVANSSISLKKTNSNKQRKRSVCNSSINSSKSNRQDNTIEYQKNQESNYKSNNDNYRNNNNNYQNNYHNNNNNNNNNNRDDSNNRHNSNNNRRGGFNQNNNQRNWGNQRNQRNSNDINRPRQNRFRDNNQQGQSGWHQRQDRNFNNNNNNYHNKNYHNNNNQFSDRNNQRNNNRNSFGNSRNFNNNNNDNNYNNNSNNNNRYNRYQNYDRNTNNHQQTQGTSPAIQQQDDNDVDY